MLECRAALVILLMNRWHLRQQRLCSILAGKCSTTLQLKSESKLMVNLLSVVFHLYLISTKDFVHWGYLFLLWCQTIQTRILLMKRLIRCMVYHVLVWLAVLILRCSVVLIILLVEIRKSVIVCDKFILILLLWKLVNLAYIQPVFFIWDVLVRLAYAADVTDILSLIWWPCILVFHSLDITFL